MNFIEKINVHIVFCTMTFNNYPYIVHLQHYISKNKSMVCLIVNNCTQLYRTPYACVIRDIKLDEIYKIVIESFG